MVLSSTASPPTATLVAERVRERLRAERTDPSRDPEFAAHIARAEVRRHNDFALARGLAPVDDASSLVTASVSASRTRSMSIRAMVEPCSSGNANRSCSRLRAKTVLPAPMNAILANVNGPFVGE